MKERVGLENVNGNHQSLDWTLDWKAEALLTGHSHTSPSLPTKLQWVENVFLSYSRTLLLFRAAGELNRRNWC